MQHGGFDNEAVECETDLTQTYHPKLEGIWKLENSGNSKKSNDYHLPAPGKPRILVGERKSP